MNLSKLTKHPIYSAIFNRFVGQAAKGEEKYGALVQPTNLKASEWVDHALEEATDKLVYLECLKEEVLRLEKLRSEMKAIAYLYHDTDAGREVEKVLKKLRLED